MYKKTNLKFTYEKFRREDRVEQTLKARQSSRFKRLSSVRNLDSDLLCDDSSKCDENDNQKLDNKLEEQTEKRPMSRLEMLKKWREEQQKRREEEMKKKPPPFYVGKAAVKKPIPNKAAQGVNMTFKQENSRLLGLKVPPKSINVTSAKNTPSRIKTPTVSSGLQKSVNQTSSIQKTFSKPVTASVKTNSKTGINEKPSGNFKPTSYLSQKSKPISMMPSKPAQKHSSAETLKSVQSRKVTEVPKSVPGIAKGVPVKSSAKGIPVVKTQSKIQAPVRQPGTGIPKFPAKPCIKTPVKRTQIKVPSIPTKSNGSQRGLPTVSGIVKKISDNPKKTNETIKIPEKVQSCEDNMELTFNSDISIIKPSFAPADFVFEPPAELVSFALGDDEDDDPYMVLKRVKQLRRTSTPEKFPGSNPSSERCSTSSSKTPPKLLENATGNDAEAPDSVNVAPQPSKAGNITSEVIDEPLNTNKTFLKSPDKSADSNFEISDLLSTTPLPLKNETTSKGIDDHSLNGSVTPETAVIEIVKASGTFLCDEEVPGNTDDDSVLKKNDVVAVEMLNHETQCDATKTPEKESNKSDEVNADLKEISVEVASNMDGQKTQCEAVVNTLKNDSLGIIDLKTTVDEAASDKCKDETEFPSVFGSLKEDASPSLDDSLGIIDLNMESPLLEPTSLMKLEDDKVSKADTTELEVIKPAVRKSGAVPKRTSILKSISTLEAISEISEFDSCQKGIGSADSKKDACATPRRSKRLSVKKSIKDVAKDLEKIIDIESPQCSSSLTPRRSARLQKAATTKLEEADCAVSSPFVPRRSMRLIDLNTPDRKERSKTDLTYNFGKLSLNDSENMDPQLLLEKLESPGANKSRKVSLLYSPEKKRNSMRKSIRGDLMSFSPA